VVPPDEGLASDRRKHEAAGPPATATAAANLARLRAQQNRFVPRMMRLCAAAHPYYRELLRKLGLGPQDFQAVEDLRKLPLLPKQDYIRNPGMFRLELGDSEELTLEETTLADVIYTAGSTGKPAPFYDTVHDRFARIHLMKRSAEIAGIRPGDTVMNLFPLTSVPHQGFLSATWGAMAVGSKLLSGLTGRPYPDFRVHNRMDDSIGAIEREKVTVLWGITSYVRRLIMRAQELGKDFRSARLAMVMGEPCPAGMREDIRSRLISLGSKNPAINNGYGATEMIGPANECAEGGGRHIPAPEQFYFEVIERESCAPVPDGEKGMLVMSHLNRRGTVLLRYVMGDVVAMTHETCPHCGRREPRFLGDPFRVDGLVKVKGTLINPQPLNEELTRLLSQGVAEYQVVITREDPADKFSPDAVLLRVACAAEDRERIAREAVALISRVAEIVPGIEFLAADGFSEIAGDYKFKRFIDER